MATSYPTLAGEKSISSFLHTCVETEFVNALTKVHNRYRNLGNIKTDKIKKKIYYK